MRRPKHNVLLIVEGAKDEPRLVDSLFKAFAHDEEWLIHLYGTVIHDLVARINTDYDGDYDSIEIRKVLVEMLPDNLARAALGIVAVARQVWVDKIGNLDAGFGQLFPKLRTRPFCVAQNEKTLALNERRNLLL